MSYDKVFVPGKGSLKIGRVTKIESEGKDKGGKVILENGENVKYDVLVLATGNNWQGTVAEYPSTKKEIKFVVDEWREKIKAASTIAVGGGGAVGIGKCPYLVGNISIPNIVHRTGQRNQAFLSRMSIILSFRLFSYLQSLV